MFSTMAMMSSFADPHFSPAIRQSPSPYVTPPPAPAAAAAGGIIHESVMIASRSSGRRWHVIDQVGECLFGEVLRAMDIVHGGYYAIKQMSLEMISRRAGHNSEDPFKEVSALQFLQAHGPHPNVIEVVEVLRDAEYIYVVLPYCHGGELFRRVAANRVANRGLSEDVARPMLRGLLAGMAFLHSLRICHRDMSLENILLTEHDQVKIIDFGMVLILGQQQAQGHIGEEGEGRVDFHSGGSNSSSARSISPAGPFGKKHYMAPEVAMGEQDYDGFAVDVWAVGVIMFITLAGIPPFNTPIPVEDERCRVIAADGRLLDLVRGWGMHLSSEAVNLIQACLVLDPSERASMHELMNHPWFA